MSSTPPPALVRPAEQVNAEIRALWPHRDVRLTDAERERYEELLREYAAALRGEVVEAA